MERKARKEKSHEGLSRPKSFGINGRDGGIRTRDPLNPIQVRYQAAPRPDPDENDGGSGFFAGKEACDLLELREGPCHPGVR